MKRLILSLLSLLLSIAYVNTSQAQTYVTSEACKICHPLHFADWEASGHPYKFSVVQNNEPPTYPVEAINFQSSWLDSLGDGTHTWDDIAGVIGGYGWKTRFVGQDGHIIGTANSSYPDAGGGHNQINFFGGEFHNWSNYNATNEKIYNYSCFKCHTTGGDTVGTWLPAVPGLGTFSEGGIGCESCHGPGSDHVSAPTKDNIDLVYEFAHLDNPLGGLSVDGVVHTPNPAGNDVNFLCGTCHNRSYTDPINSSGGFIRHHEQWDEFLATKHSELGFSCVTCHDPHKRVIWDGDGITTQCATCHSGQASIVNHAGATTCIDCHMPFAAKSGTKIGSSGYRGDVRSHLMLINTSTESMFTDDGSAVKDDDDRKAALSPHFACLGCHNDDPNDGIQDMTVEEASAAAEGMHELSAIGELEAGQFDLRLFPNPTMGDVNILFNLSNSEEITVNIYDPSGKLVYTIPEQLSPSGEFTIRWDGREISGKNAAAGVYYVSANNRKGITSVAKLLKIE